MPELILTNDHCYLLNGKPIDGLTSTIKEAGLIRDNDEWYMQRGLAIHKATELWDKNILDEKSIDPQIFGYFESWKQFRKDQNYIPTHIEYQIYHPDLLVGMTIDRLPGPLDLKSGSPEPWHILQIACQWDALKSNYYNGHPLLKLIAQPMNVYLDAEGGPPKVKIYKYSELKEAFKVYASMVHFLRWCRSMGVGFKKGESNE